MTKEQLINLFYKLNKLSNLSGAKIGYVIARNRIILEKEVLAIEKMAAFSDGYMEFEVKRLELAKKMAKKDGNGQDIVINDQFVMEDQAAFDKAFEKLKNDNKEVVKAREDQVKYYNQALKDEIEIDFFKIKLADIPDAVTAEQMQILWPFIADEN